MSDQDTQQNPAEDAASEEEQQNLAEAAESQEDGPEDAWDPERARRKIGKINSENKALRERATKAEEKAAGVEDLTKENGSLKASVLQLEVGYELGLPLAIAKRLQGATREEMLADAEALVELVSPAKRPPSNRPAETLRGGGSPEREPEETDLSKLGDRMFRR